VKRKGWGWERGAYSTNAVSIASDTLREYKGTGGSASAAHENARIVKRGRKESGTDKRGGEREREKTYVSNEELGTGVFEGNMTTI
jgi:hypothetical protein